MDDDNRKSTEHKEDKQPKPKHQPDIVLQLEDGNVGETETDVCVPEPRGLSIEQTSTSRQSLLQRQKLDEVRALVKELIEDIMPAYETQDTTIERKTKEDPTLAEKQLLAQTSIRRYDDERLKRILGLLDRYTQNLELIEERMLSTRPETRCITDKQPTHVELDSSTELQLTKCTEFGTQTSIRMNVTSSNAAKNLPRTTQPQLQQHQDAVPPCERRHHTIFISTNGAAAHPAPAQRRSLIGRVGQTLGDFAAAFCLCLQVNKDCVFCLGFFVAFVVSASFLTAFFYRTISLTAMPIRVPIPAPGTSEPPQGLATIRFNGGYYYIYNSQRQHFV